MRKGPALILSGLAGIAALGLLGPSALASRTPLVGAVFAPWDVTAQRNASLAALQTKQIPLALQFARRAVAAMPYEQFGLTLAASGTDANRRLEALNLSSALGWRDVTTNVMLVEAALRENQPEIAAQRIDALGRTQDAGIAGPYADRLLALPGGIDALADRAAKRGKLDWWSRYFRQPPANAEAMGLRAALVRKFDAGDGSWLRDAVDDMAQGFIAADASDQGLVLWRDTLTKPGDFQGAIYDGTFAQFDPEAHAIGGEWRLAGQSPATVEALEGGGLAIDQANERAGNVISQAVLLAPGRYRLKVAGEAERGNAQGFDWSVSCAGKGRLPLARSGTGSGPTGEWSLVVPQDCKAGSLALLAKRNANSAGTRLLLRSVALDKVS